MANSIGSKPMNRSTNVTFLVVRHIQADDFEPGRVILRGVTAEAEGSYKCEVSAEGTFHTDSAEANLTVIGMILPL